MCTCLYNVDGIGKTSSKPPRVLAKAAERQVVLNKRTTALVFCCNVAGSFKLSLKYFGRKKMNPRLLDGVSPGTQGTCTLAMVGSVVQLSSNE